MNNRLVKIICITFLMSSILSGCSTSLKEENAALNKEIAALNEKNTALEKSIADLNKQLEDQKYLNDLSAMPAFSNDSNIYPIYSADLSTYEIEKDAYIYISEETPLKQKLNILAEALSQLYFSGLPIEVVRIESIDNKKVAVVNLKEAPENRGKTDPKDTKGKTWAFQYMQGSTGGTITQTELIETMLQRQYQWEWVDGVRFLYEGGVCDYEHAYSLKDINYRN